MVKNVFVLLLAVCVSAIVTAQTIEGSWLGKLNIGGGLRMVLNVKKVNDSLLSATFDSPDQKAFGIVCSKTSLVGDSLLVEIKSINCNYRGKWDGKNDIVGVMLQGTSSNAINLKRISEEERPKPIVEKPKPQTPHAPFNYFSEDVMYKNADSSISFGATFTRPTGAGKYPTVIIISGSGTQNRNGSTFGHELYWVLADYLTKQGIGVLRVDDRGAGSTTLGENFRKLTTADFANDVEASIAYLQTRQDVDTKNIGLIGHSEGGLIAPMVASRNKQVAFIVLLAGPGQTGEDIWKYQMRRSFIKKNIDSANLPLAASLVNGMQDAFKQYDSLPLVEEAMKTTYSNWKKNVSDSLERAMLYTVGPKAYLNIAEQYKNGLAWLKYFMNANPAVYLQKLKIPVLAVNGESDIQVLATPNLQAIDKALKKAGNKQYTIKMFPHLNHLFQTCTSPDESYAKIEETFSPIALSYISEWIKLHVKK